MTRAGEAFPSFGRAKAGQGEHDIRPIVGHPRDGLSRLQIMIIWLLLALALFYILEERRRANQAPAAHNSDIGDPPQSLETSPLTIPPINQVSAGGVDIPVPPATQASPYTQQAYPATPYDDSGPAGPVGEERSYVRAIRRQVDLPGGAPGTKNGLTLVLDLTSPDAPAMSAGAAAGGQEAAYATLLHGRSTLVLQGTIIAAVLETALNSDVPGLARGIVSRDVRGFDGSSVIIPRGSRLIGDYKADTAPGFHRVMISWVQLVRPDGVTIRLGSPASSPLGEIGVGGRVDTHFLSRFSGAILRSAIDIGVNIATARASGGPSPVFLGLPGQASQAFQPLFPAANRPNTIKVKQGTEIAVFVARDLDFSGVPAAP